MFDKKKYMKKYRKDKKGHIKKYNKKYHKEYSKKNRDKLTQDCKQWRKDNPEKVKKINQKCYRNHIEERREYGRQYSQNNIDYYREGIKQWRKNNPERIKKLRENWFKSHPNFMKQYCKIKRRIDLKYNLNNKMRLAIWQSLKGNKNNRHWEGLVNYKLIELIKHLKSTIPEYYTWQDFLNNKLHIDHIIPISVFNFDKPENPDFKKCWALNNLRLLPAKENHIKYNKLIRPFQPALKLLNISR
jgi:hypothetical protein